MLTRAERECFILTPKHYLRLKERKYFRGTGRGENKSARALLYVLRGGGWTHLCTWHHTHERYTRLPTGESPIGGHYREHWLNGDPVPILSEKPSINNLLTSYSLKIIDVGTDSIDAYIREGLNIADSQPVLNDKQMNGWIK